MKKVLILCAHRPKRSPSQRYRFEQYLNFLETNGFQFTWSYLLDQEDDRKFYSTGNVLSKVFIIRKSIAIRRKDVRRFKDFDIIFIQREANFLGNSIYEKKAFESGAKVIFDFDDSIWLSDTSPGNKKYEWIKKPGKFFDNLHYAHCVIAGNEYLAEKAREVNKNVHIIPTTIDTDIHIPMPELRNNDSVVIGWSGSISTIKHFKTLTPVLKRLKEKYRNKISFKIIGQENYDSNELDIGSVQWTEKDEVEQLNTFDIGIMPLQDDEWANGKCGLKGLSYMSCAVPAVMSNVGVNNVIINDCVNGFLAANEEDWFNKLCLLIDSNELRTRLGKEGRKTVISNYSVLANRDKYLQVFKNAGSS